MGSTRKFPVLTDAAIAKAKPAPATNAGRAYFLRDGMLPGFGVRVTQTGSKSFIYETALNRRSHRWTLGPYPDLSLSAAREKARQWRLLVREGIDPTLERQRRKSAPTFGALCDRWLDEHARPNKRSAHEDERRIAQLLGPWRNRTVAEITPEDVFDLQARIRRDRGPVASNRAMALVRAILHKAQTDWRVVEGPLPTDGVKFYRETPRERVLSTDELRRLIGAILAEPEPWRQVFLLYLLTGARRREILSAQWTDIDREAGTWSFPSHRRKSGRAHTLPLTSLVAGLLKSLPGGEGSPYLFPSPTSALGYLQEPKKPWRRTLERAGIEDFHIHDLRHVQGTVQAVLGSNVAMIARILGHASHVSATRYINLAATDPVRAPLERAERHLIEAAPELGQALDVTSRRRRKP